MCSSLQAGQLELTHKGRAVYDSALPLEPAMRLYDSCSRAEDGRRLLCGAGQGSAQAAWCASIAAELVS